MRCVLLVALLAVACLAQAPDDLIHKLGDEDFEVREAASKSLEEQGEAARAALLKAQDNPDAEVRQRVALILRELDRSAAVRARAEKVQALRKLTTPAFDPKTLKPLVEKKGRITRAEVWGPDSSYLVTETITILQGGGITLRAGTVVLLAEGVSIRIETESDGGATLRAEGEPRRPVVFTSVAERDGKPGHWGQFLSRDATLVLRHVQFRRSRGVNLHGGYGTNVIEEVGVYHTLGDGLKLSGQAGEPKGLRICEATGTGLIVGACFPMGTGATITRCGVGVRYEAGAYGAFADLHIAETRDEALLVLGKCFPRFERLIIADAGTGVRVAGGSNPNLLDATVDGTRGDGIVVEAGSWPQLSDVKIARAGGWGLAVKTGSEPMVHRLVTEACKSGSQSVEPGCQVFGPNDFPRGGPGRRRPQ